MLHHAVPEEVAEAVNVFAGDCLMCPMAEPG
jgi:hypothetical protein